MCDEIYNGLVNYEQSDNNCCFDKNATLVIKQEAIVHNVKYIKETTGAKVIAVLKENGYGLGVANLYHIIKDQDIHMFAVTSTCEAIALREEGCKTDILMLTPIADFCELLLMVSHNVVIALGDEKQLDVLRDIHELTGKRPRVHVQIDSGLGRYGFNVDNLPDLKHYQDYISVEGCFTHLAGSVKSACDYKRSVEKQVKVFKQALGKIRAKGIDTGLCHISNSKAAVTFGALGFDAVRVGSAILGKVCVKSGLEEAVWLESKVFSVYNRQEGEHIGYRGEAALKRDSNLAVVRVGTGCGIGLIQKGTVDYTLGAMFKNMIRKINSVPYFCVWINGKKSPVIGRIGIAHMTVDVTENKVKEGDIVKVQVNPLYVHPYIRRMVV